MATRAKHKERSKRRHTQKETAKNWFFTCCGRYAYGIAQDKKYR